MYLLLMVLEVEQFYIKVPGNSVLSYSLSYHYHIINISLSYHYRTLSYHGSHMCPHMVEKQRFPLIPPCCLLQYHRHLMGEGLHLDLRGSAMTTPAQISSVQG